jgi:transcriptional regulator
VYLPPHFRVEDEAVLHDVIRARPLGLLITPNIDGVLADPLPFQLLTDGPCRLAAHLARANPQVAAIGQGADVIVVFQAEDSYISPGWYATKRETGKVVPTWNYVIVQARGRAVLHDDPAWLHAQVSDLTDRHEAGRPDPWAVTDAPQPYVAAQLRAIVGLEIAVTRLEGKFKLSQNRNEPDRRGVARGLATGTTPGAAALARRMKGQ